MARYGLCGVYIYIYTQRGLSRGSGRANGKGSGWERWVDVIHRRRGFTQKQILHLEHGESLKSRNIEIF
jgi:hypothetical protein